MNFIMLRRIQELCFMGMIIFLPLGNIPVSFRVINTLYSLPLLCCLIGICLVFIENRKNDNLENTKTSLYGGKYKYFFLLYVGWPIFCILIGSVQYPYFYEINMINVPWMKQLQDVFSFAGKEYIDSICSAILFMYRDIKEELFPMGAGIALVFHLYKNNWKRGVKMCIVASTILASFCILYSIPEMIWLWTNSTVCELILRTVNVYLYDVPLPPAWHPPLLWNGQLRSLFDEPSSLGIISSFIYPMLFLIPCNRHRYYIGKVILISIFFLMILMTQSRTAVGVLIGEFLLLGLYLGVIKGTVIHNVAKGTSGTDAVNVNQLNETVDQAKTHYYSVKSTSANNYNNDGAAGEDSMAAGVGAKALKKRSAAIGNNVEAQGEGSIALGTGYEEINGGTPTITQTVAASGYKYNMAIGAGAQSEGNHSIAMGTRAVTTIKNGGTSVDKAVAIGYAAGASDDKTVAIGSEAKSNSRSAVALGDRAHALANDALAIGTTASATGESSGAIGTANTVNGAGTYVIGARNSAPTTPVASNGSNITAVNSGVFGNENTLDGENNRVTGNSNIVKKETATGLTDIMLTGNNNTVSGDTDTTTQDDAGKVSGITITGSKNTVKAKNNTKNLTDVQIVGNNNKIDTSNKALDLSNTQILGSNVNATMGNSVYLGSGSAYVADSASTKGMAVYNSDGTYAYAGGTPAGVVTVGAKGKERRIQNVAAGLVAPQSTDAVNGSQLYTMTRPLRFGGDNSTIGATSAADVNVVKRGSDQAMAILGGADGSKLSVITISVW